MPFVSESQRKWMYANKPAMAKRWQKHTPKGKKLPEKVKKAYYKLGAVLALNDVGYNQRGASHDPKEET